MTADPDRWQALTPGDVFELRGLKWPDRPQNAARVGYLGEDEFGRWIGAAEGDPWWSVDRSRSGVCIASVVKVIPPEAHWSACFQAIDPVVDVDIVLPARWNGTVLDEVDLELDVLRSTEGRVWVRDRDEFERVREHWPMPDELVRQAEETCRSVLASVEKRAEPFDQVGRRWLSSFMDERQSILP